MNEYFNQVVDIVDVFNPKPVFTPSSSVHKPSIPYDPNFTMYYYHKTKPKEGPLASLTINSPMPDLQFSAI